MNALNFDRMLDYSCPPLLKELFDTVIELDCLSGETVVLKCSDELYQLEGAELFDGEDFRNKFLTMIADAEEQKMLLKIFDNIKSDGVDYIYRNFTLKKSQTNGQYSNGCIVGIRNWCWICFNSRHSEEDCSNSETCDFENVLSFSSRTENVDDVNRYISDLFFKTFVYLSQKEKNEAKQKQADGIRNAQERGVRFGRQKKDIPAEFYPLYFRYKNGELSSRKCGDKLAVSHSTFLKWVKETNNISAEI